MWLQLSCLGWMRLIIDGYSFKNIVSLYLWKACVDLKIRSDLDWNSDLNSLFWFGADQYTGDFNVEGWIF